MPSAVVIDASAFAAFLLREPVGKKLDSTLEALADGKIELHVPALFAFEMLNILTVAERRKRITADQTGKLVAEWETLPITEDATPNPAARRRILALAHRHQLSAYDATYLELAERLQANLLTLDSDILRLKKIYRWIS